MCLKPREANCMLSNRKDYVDEFLKSHGYMCIVGIYTIHLARVYNKNKYILIINQDKSL
jgi:hypothetical protein